MATRQEIQKLKISIQEENVILQRVKRMLQWSVMFTVVCLLFIFTFLKREPYHTWRIVTIVLAVIFGTLSAFSGLSYWNGRKHLIQKINDLDAKK